MTEPLQDVVIAVDLDASPDVVERLKAAGLEVTETLPTAQVVTGSIPASHLPALEHVDGVTAVEAVRRVDVPPPDAPVQ